jgi:hypothetical protein
MKCRRCGHQPVAGQVFKGDEAQSCAETQISDRTMHE